MARHKLKKPIYRLRTNRDGYFILSWTDPATGTNKTKSLATKDKREAEAQQGAVIATLAAPQPLKTLTVGAVIDAYLVKHPGEKSSLTPVKERLGALAISAVDDSVAESYADWRVNARRVRVDMYDDAAGKPPKKGKPLSAGTIRRDLEMLRAALEWGARNKLGYKVGDIGTFAMPLEKEPARDRWLTREECRRLIYDGCKDTAHLSLFVRIALAVGARREAILQLTWDRVTWPDLEKPLRWVNDDDLQIEYETLIEPVLLDFGRGVGKKRRVRHVPIGDNAGLYRELLAAKEKAKSKYVIEWKGESIKDVKTALNKAYERAKIPDASGAHLLRHTCCTLLVMSGLSYVQVGKIVGATAKVIEDTYGHHSHEFLQAAGSATAF
jgi:integrase